ncbi:MAG: hypothetical protein U9Q15_01345 [Patescibacteria group bacterium]|nr:hypothetical protein [Patescibacteria group bacterium]
MVPQIDNIEYIEVSNNIEALILENNLIKQHKPRYNILLKDDKSFVYIKIHTTEQFPRITIVRRPTKDKNLYFGPYTSANRIKKLLQFLRGIFPYRTCRMSIVIEEKKTQLKNIDRNTPCLDYHIKKCGAPCTALTTPEEYQHTIDGIVSFLKGNT